MNKTVLISLLMLSFPAVADDAADFIAKADANRSKVGLVYDMTIDSPEGSITYRGAQKGAKWRMEGTYNGVKTLILFDGREVTVSSLGMAFKSSNVPNYSTLPIGESGYVLGEETAKNGVPCRMVTKAPDIAMCISEKLGVPVYTKSGDTVMTLTKIHPQVVKDDAFALPKGTQVLDMSSAMNFGG